MNLFTSFAANNALWVMWYRLIVPYPDTIMQNGVGSPEGKYFDVWWHIAIIFVQPVSKFNFKLMTHYI